MENGNQLIFAKALSRLNALQENMPTGHEVKEQYVAEFHSILDQLEGSSKISLQEFRVPANQVRPAVAGGNYVSGETFYTDENYCERDFLRMKVSAVLTLFTLVTETGNSKEQIGFSKS